MNTTRRNFLGASAGGAALLAMGGAPLSQELFAEEAPEVIRGAGVPEGVVQLIWNENPLGASPKAVEAVSKALHASNRYSRPLFIEKVIAAYHGVDPKLVTKGVGATELLYNVPMALLSRGDNMIMADPAYMTCGKVAETLIGAEVKRIPLTPNWEHDLDGFKAAIDDRTRFIMICNPNNPTGTITPASKIRKFLDEIPRHIPVMIDEAYFDYADDPQYESFDQYPAQGRNVVVVRTFSKVYGLAGLRIGYAIAGEDLSKRIREFNYRRLTNLVAHYAVPAALQDREFVEKTKQSAREGKEYLYKAFSALGITIPRSETNHIYVDLEKESLPLVTKLAERKIYVRPGRDWSRPTTFRVSVGTMPENEALMRALKELA